MQHKTGTRPWVRCVPVFVFGGDSAAQRVRQCEPGGAAALGSPPWGSWRASGEPERVQAVAIWENAEIAAGYPLSYDTFSVFVTAYTLSVTAYAVPALPKGEPRGGRCPPSAPKLQRGSIGGAAACRRGQVSANPAAQPPLAPPMGELASQRRA